MTERLFDFDSHLKIFTATVISCTQVKVGKDILWRVYLNKTAFYPEGGGQKGDEGWILEGNRAEKDFFQITEGEKKLSSETVSVSDTQEEDGEIYSVASKELPVGTLVTGLINFEIRFRRMQNHTGEHIVSGQINKYFKLNNVGFHMGSEDVTLDIDGVLTKNDIDFIEKKANEAVFANAEVKAEYPSTEALEKMLYRSKKEIKEGLRIVTVNGYDCCACCSPHVKRTGEIGIIKITNFINYKSGMRIHMLCGADAIEYIGSCIEPLKEASAFLSVKPFEIWDGVQRLAEKAEKEKAQSNLLKSRIISLLLEKASGDGNFCIFENSSDAIFLRNIAALGIEKINGVCGVFSGDEENGYRYVAASKTVPMRDFCNEMNSRLNGRGGGDNELVQGSVKAKRSDIEAFFKV